MNTLRLCCSAVAAGSVIYLLIPLRDARPVQGVPRSADTANLAAFLMSKHDDDLRRSPLFQVGPDSGGLSDSRSLVLFGIMQGRQNRALLGPVGGKPVWVAEGETANGLILTKVRASAVVLAWPEGASELRLFSSSDKSGASGARSTERDP